MNAILKYPGAKNRLARWIISNMPEHDVYLEPFGGSMAVLLNKPRSHIETVNDLSSDIVNFFRVIRDQSDELIKVIKYTPFARQEYEKAYLGNETDSDIEKARMFCVKCWQGFGSGNRYQNGFITGQQANSPNPAHAWSELPDSLRLAVARLQGVQIECLEAIELIKRYCTKDVFIYCDPPYLPDTRKNYLYDYEMNSNQHIELLHLLRNHPGKVMISGYENDLYDAMLNDWQKAVKETCAEHGLKRTEVLWMNYDQQLKLF